MKSTMQSSSSWIYYVLIMGLFFSVSAAGGDSAALTNEAAVSPAASAVVNSAPAGKKAAVNTGTSSRPAIAIEVESGVLYGLFRKEDGPFLIDGSVIVPSGQVLEFEPGCTIYMGGTNTTITVFGQIMAQGTAQDPIIFQSVNPVPRAGDWDRIYVRSRNRSMFAHCVVRHSQYGLYAENSSVSVDHCTFERNALHGMAVKNADVLISTATFQNGHALALFMLPGSNVTAESLAIHDNATAIVCTEKSTFKIERGRITRNGIGIAVRENASVSVVEAEITRNKIGLVSELDIPRKMQKVVFENTTDFKRIKPDAMAALLASQKTTVALAGAPDTSIQMGPGFKPGYVILPPPQEAQTSFIGNIEAGFTYARPHSLPNERDHAVVTQSRYHEGDRYYDGLQPELTIFTQGKRSGADVTLNADLYGNSWVGGLKKNMFALSMNYENQQLLIGDSYENLSETSMSGRKITGIKFSGNFWEMGRGTKRVEFKLIGGESVAPKDSGQNDFDVPNSIVASGFSVRQQFTYLASLTFKPTLYSAISARGIIARDQTNKGLFRPDIGDSAAPLPISSQTGIIDGTVSLLEGNLELFVEIDLGADDTIPPDDFAEVAWYLPQIKTAVPRVFGLLNPDSMRSNMALTAGTRGKLFETDVSVSVTEIRPGYFSAGNPYIETDRRYMTLTGERQFGEKVDGKAEYQYERTSVSQTLAANNSSPVDKNWLTVTGAWRPAENVPEFSADYTIRYESNNDKGIGFDTVDVDTALLVVESEKEYGARIMNHVCGIEGKQRLENGIDYSIKYRFSFDNDMSAYPDPASIDVGDKWNHEISGRLGFAIAKRLTNRLNASLRYKLENQDSLHATMVKVGDNLRLTIIPRKLTLTLKGDATWRSEDEYAVETEAWKNTRSLQYSSEGELKYAITSKFSASAFARYEKARDQNEGSDNYRVTIGGVHMMYLF